MTDAEIHKLQLYYGLAIRSVGNLESMKRNIWAIHFHKGSTDDNPQHGLCPDGPDSWCKFKKALVLQQEYKHSSNLPGDVMLATKPVFQDLAKDELLKRCLHGQTQNVNESFNNLVWSKIPKRVFVRIITLKMGIYDAILTFNDGCVSKLSVYEQLGMKLSKGSIQVLKSVDLVRVKEAEKAFLNMTRLAKQKKRLLRR